MYHDGVVCLVYFLVPYLLKDLVGAEHPAGIRCQKVQDIELDGRQLDLLSVDNDLVVIFIDGEGDYRLLQRNRRLPLSHSLYQLAFFQVPERSTLLQSRQYGSHQIL